MTDINISKEYKEYQEQREARIMRRVKAYIAGEFTLDEFYGLERLDVDSDRYNGFKETAAELQDLNEAEKEKAQEPEVPKSRAPELDNMTKEEYNALSLQEQTRLYNLDPIRVREIVETRPAYMDKIDPRPKPRDYTGTTLEDFKKMSLAELGELANTDRALYDQLYAESTEGVHNAG